MQLVEWKLGGRSWTSQSLYVSPRMGGGPRTFPGGVSKWQWKKMQEKKSKQILKARLLRERQLYEMRKRAELKAVELEKPWEMTRATQAPTLFAVTSDDQLQAMADRFVKPGAIDLWTDRDGPHSHSAVYLTQDGKPSARVFPRDALYSTQPYSLASPLPPAHSHNDHSSNPSPSRYLPQYKHDGRSSKPSLSRYPPPQTHNGRSSNPSLSRYPAQNHNGRCPNPSPSRYPPQNHNGRCPNPSPSRYLPSETYAGRNSNPSLPQNHNRRSSNPSPSRYSPQNTDGRRSNHSPSRYPPLQNHSGRSSNPSPSNYPPQNRNSTSMIGKSIVSRSISVLSSVSGQGKFNDAQIPKDNSIQKYVKDTGRQRHRFLASPEPSHAEGQDYTSKTKSPVPDSGKHSFAGFDLDKRSTPTIKDASYKSKTDLD